MKVSRDDVLHCAQLASLRLKDAEVEPLRRAMEQLLTKARSLEALDLEDVPPFSLDQPLPRRPDLPRPSLSQAEALANAPDQARGHFKVPKVL